MNAIKLPSLVELFRAYSNHLTKRVSQVFDFLNLVNGGLATEKAFSLNIGQIFLPAMAASLLVYQAVQERNKPGGDPTKWAKDVGNAAVDTALINLTSGVYPAMMVGKSIYHAAQQDNGYDQTQAVVKTVAGMGSGWLGFYLGQMLSEQMVSLEDNALSKLKPEEMTGFFRQLESKYGNVFKPGDLTSTFQKLADSITDLRKFKLDYIDNGAKSITEIKELRGVVDTLKGTLLQQLDQIPRGEVDQLLKQPTMKALESKVLTLFHHLENSQSIQVQLGRFLNPVTGFLLASMVGGYFATQAMMKFFKKTNPGLEQQQALDLSFQTQPLRAQSQNPMRYGGMAQIRGAGYNYHPQALPFNTSSWVL